MFVSPAANAIAVFLSFAAAMLALVRRRIHFVFLNFSHFVDNKIFLAFQKSNGIVS